MSTFKTITINAEMSAKRTLASILSEYNVNSSDVTIDGQYATIFVSGNRNERITLPTNGDLWVLATDDGTVTTNDKDGKFFKYFIKTEDNELCLNEEQTVSLLRERISEMVVPVTKIDLLNMALSKMAKPGSNLEDVNEFLDSMIADDLDTRGVIHISKRNIANMKRRASRRK